MSEPVVAIVAAVIAALARVKRTNGYQNDVKTIYEIPLLPEQLAESAMPAFFVLEAEEGESWEWDDANVYRARLPLVIGGVVSDGGIDLTKADRVRRIRSFENDARKALLQDPFFAGTCKDLILSKARRYPDFDRPFAFFETDMRVTYHFNRGSL